MECEYNKSCYTCTKPYLKNDADKPFSFLANYPAKDYYWGKKSSKVLYVGVNPFSTTIGENHYFSLELLRKGPGLNTYFGTIQKWYPYLYEAIGLEKGVAFTDLIKCSSGSFPLKGMRVSDFDVVFRNCRTHLQVLINEMVQANLKTIIVSGVHPCWHMLDMYFPDQNNFDKSIDNVCLTTNISSKNINVVFFRQFMGRKDVSHTYRQKATQLLKDVLLH